MKPVAPAMAAGMSSSGNASRIAVSVRAGHDQLAIGAQ
jgi:hypothetical protein